jgi:uncharacterized protein (DUF924 family)
VNKVAATVVLALVFGMARTGGAEPPSVVGADPVAAVGTPAAAVRVVEFWNEAGKSLWFAKDDAFDRRFRDAFLPLHEAAARGELDGWASSADGMLALLILLDQFPRNAFRDTPRMYATDAKARAIAAAAVAAGLDREVCDELALFVYLPFGHSEELADQERAVDLTRRLGPVDRAMAEHHRDIVKRFGRFPHRNRILGRAMLPEEQSYLDHGGYLGACCSDGARPEICGGTACSAGAELRPAPAAARRARRAARAWAPNETSPQTAATFGAIL